MAGTRSLNYVRSPSSVNGQAFLPSLLLRVRTARQQLHRLMPADRRHLLSDGLPSTKQPTASFADHENGSAKASVDVGLAPRFVEQIR